MNAKPGTYGLVLQADTETVVQVGRWGAIDIRPDYYIYIGSAFGPGGVLARVSRHCRKKKSKHWHIDYLREIAALESVWYSQRQTRLEHRWAKALATWGNTEPVHGFGCSDCSCDSHLFYCKKPPTLAGFAKIVGCSIKSWSCDETDLLAGADRMSVNRP
ncbi:MAG: GIY-YIG nuclease family protein [Candidatus Thiodiazotropha endolucinida]